MQSEKHCNASPEPGCIPASGDSPKSWKSATLFDSFRYAGQGIAAAAKERNFRIHCFAGCIALLLCALLHVAAWGWAAVLISIGLVMAAECFNTAIEAAVDLASPGIHPLAKLAKDCAAGAVSILAVTAVLVGIVVYGSAIISAI